MPKKTYRAANSLSYYGEQLEDKDYNVIRDIKGILNAEIGYAYFKAVAFLQPASTIDRRILELGYSDDLEIIA